MATQNPEEDFVELDDAAWRTPVTDQIAAPASADPGLLPFHERSWEDFERAMLVIAEHVDGLRSVRLYGTRGQAQKGIDLYGVDDDTRTVAYQPKRVRSFDEGDLEAAVKAFDVKQRAVDAKRLVVCVGCETDRTQMSEKLQTLRKAHPHLEIELYDRRRLSELLKTRPELVRRLFGETWAGAFCDGLQWPVPRLCPADVLADALVRGPLKALGLDETLNRCNELAPSDPAPAALGVERIVALLT